MEAWNGFIDQLPGGGALPTAPTRDLEPERRFSLPGPWTLYLRSSEDSEIASINLMAAQVPQERSERCNRNLTYPRALESWRPSLDLGPELSVAVGPPWPAHARPSNPR